MVHAQPYSVLKESTDGTNFPDAWTFESGNRWLQGFQELLPAAMSFASAWTRDFISTP